MATLGVAAGLLIGFTLGAVVAPVAGGAGPAVWTGLPLLGAWIGGVVAARRDAELSALRRRPVSSETRVLDTSVIIDGRIVDVCEAGFLEGACSCRAWSSASCRR